MNVYVRNTTNNGWKTNSNDKEKKKHLDLGSIILLSLQS